MHAFDFIDAAPHGVIAAAPVPSVAWVAPFALLLLAIAALPLMKATHHWWERNRNKLLVGLVLGLLTLAHYQTRGFGVAVHGDDLAHAMRSAGYTLEESHEHLVTPPGAAATLGALGNALLEYVPFIVLLFSLYCVAGGIAVRGDIPAHPGTNTTLLALGGVLASGIGTTGASMLLIRPVLQINSERRLVVHTVIFFILIVSNAGGCLLPTGDPPLFIGYLRGVPFFWTLNLWREWAFMLAALLAVYYVWDRLMWRRETPRALAADEAIRQRIRVIGKINFVWLAAIVAAVATLDPSKPFLKTGWTPPLLLREGVQLVIVGISFLTTPQGLRRANRFNFTAIGEVAALFIGIFITMQVPLEILQARGGELHLTHAYHFFWGTGLLSSLLDNAPTYAVFFQTANALTHDSGEGILPLMNGQFIREDLLRAISLGAVFMGANTYIGNGPNFMVKSIAESHGVKMPGFVAYMLYSMAILLPLFVLVTLLFL